jgi:hypothetical protein
MKIFLVLIITLGFVSCGGDSSGGSGSGSDTSKGSASFELSSGPTTSNNGSRNLMVEEL